MNYQCISQDRALELITKENAQVVDIRDENSYQAGHITAAIHIDNQSLGGFLESAIKDLPLIVCCYHGISSKGAAEFLANQGFDQCFSLDGGFSSWQQSGLDYE